MKNKLREICSKLKLNLLKIIEPNDLKFFVVIGLICGILMELSSLLPARVNRGIFSQMLSDHIPVATVMVLLIIQLLLIGIYHAVTWRAAKAYVNELSIHLNQKVKSFASPAFAILLGMAICCLLIGFVQPSYIKYAKVFSTLAVYFVALSFISYILRSGFKDGKSEIAKELAWVAVAAVVSAILIVPVFNTKPIEVSVKFKIEQYDLLEQASKIEGTSVKEIVTQGAVDRSVGLISDSEREL